MAHLKVPVKQAWGPEFWSMELKVEKKEVVPWLLHVWVSD